MKKYSLFTAIFLLITSLSYAQILFEKGYFIDNADKRVECLIKNTGWYKYSDKIEYKLTETSSSKFATVEEIKEFGYSGISKFKRYKVLIEKSNDGSDLDELSLSSELELKEELLFLKVILEGKATLLSFSDRNIIKYFYSIDNELPKQLISKIYREDDQVKRINQFRRQLYLNVNCEEQPIQNLGEISYIKEDLRKVFIQFNECEQSEFIEFDKKKKRDFFNLNARVGVDFSSLYVEGIDLTSRKFDFDNQQTLRVGAELEFILPINQNKWSIIIEPTYQYYNTSLKDTIEYTTVTEIQDVKVNYRSIETALGFRYYMYLSPKSKLFINAGLSIDYDFSSEIELTGRSNLDIKAFGSGIVGMGYSFTDKFNVELRYTSPRTILREYRFWVSYYQKASIIAGYNLF